VHELWAPIYNVCKQKLNQSSGHLMSDQSSFLSSEEEGTLHFLLNIVQSQIEDFNIERNLSKETAHGA